MPDYRLTYFIDKTKLDGTKRQTESKVFPTKEAADRAKDLLRSEFGDRLVACIDVAPAPKVKPSAPCGTIPVMRADAGTVSRLLAARAEHLARELLPAGKREGAEWRCGSVAGEPGRSCSVHLTGQRAGVWSDFSTGEVGDALGLVAAVHYRGDLGQALRWSARWLGLGDDAAVPAPQRAPPAPVPAARDDDLAQRRAAALAIYLQAQPSLIGTPAAAYLAARGIDLAALGRQPRALRYHPALYNREAGARMPALVAAISAVDGVHVATHRTWLQQHPDGSWKKARLQDPKMTLGSLNGATIRLQRGVSGKPLRGAVAGETIVIGEGIESCLSIAVACPELRVLSAVSLSNLGRVVLPEIVCTVVIAADNDGGNEAARRGLQRAVHHFMGAGYTVRVARAPIGGDFNDALTLPRVACA